jgi:hypothetical protein
VPIRPDLISDFVIAMRMREQNLRTVLEPMALCFEETHDRTSNELAMRVRVAIRSINALWIERRFLSAVRFGCFAWQLWSHKVLRYASPFLWGSALIANVVVAGSPAYAAMLAAQLVVIAAGIAGLVLSAMGRQLAILNKPYYFLLTNVASFIAVVRFVGGARMVTWNPVR